MTRPNLVKLRGYEFENCVPWTALIEDLSGMRPNE